MKELSEKHGYNTITISLDDLYLDHDNLVQVRTADPSNQLVRTRGQPGTHDLALARSFFESLNQGAVLIPAFDKSLFNGEGGRAPKKTWRRIPADDTIDVVVFEGWCLGFQPQEEEAVRQKWGEANMTARLSAYPTETLKDHEVDHVLEVNANLKRYCDLFMGPQHLDFLVHLDTDDLVNVYQWRIQQEQALRERTNEGMSDDEVFKFVKGYMPAYELYLDQLRRGFFTAEGPGVVKGQLRVILNPDRKIVDIVDY